MDRAEIVVAVTVPVGNGEVHEANIVRSVSPDRGRTRESAEPVVFENREVAGFAPKDHEILITVTNEISVPDVVGR